MTTVINTNIVSLTAQRSLARAQAGISTSLQRLSSGVRINSARDDAAGLAISERMTSYYRGANQAIRNANDAVSLLQTAEGALGQMNRQLQRIRELAVQSANATNSSADRSAMDQEVRQGLAEIDRIASSTAFNGQNLLDGSAGTANFQVGANAGELIGVNLNGNMHATSIGAIQRIESSDLRVVKAGTGGAFSFAGTYTTNPIAALDFSIPTAIFIGGSMTTTGALAVNYFGNQTVITVDSTNVNLNANYASVSGLASAIQAQLGSAHAGWYTVSNDGVNITIKKNAGAANATVAVSVSGFAVGAAADGQVATTTTNAGLAVDGHAVFINADYTGNVDGLIANIQSQLDATSQKAGTYSVFGTAAGISISRVGAIDVPRVDSFRGAGAAVFSPAPAATLHLGPGDLNVQLGSDPAVAITGDFATPAALGSAITAALPGVDVIVNETTGVAELRASASFAVSGTQADPSGALAFKRLSSEAQGSLADVNVLDFKKATESLLRVDAALNTVNTSRANLGAMQNRFGAIVDNLQIGAESSAAARSRIMDTDYSAETGNLTRFKILLQASMAMVAQANASQSLVLRLLRT